MKSEIIRCILTHQETAGSGSPALKKHSVGVNSAQVPFLLGPRRDPKSLRSAVEEICPSKQGNRPW
jgi:hypothetical protein